MAELYLSFFVMICFSLLGWGIVQLERIYQYPFIMGSMFVSFLLPQGFALVNNPGAAVTTEALERVLLMTCLCAAGCWVGYRSRPNPKWLKKLDVVLDEKKLFRAGLALAAQGWLFTILLARTQVQAAENGNWTGPATIYLFFAQVRNIAFGIFLLMYLNRRKPISLALAGISGWPLLGEVLVGRRQGTMTFVIIIGLCLFLERKSVPPRWLVILGILGITVFIPLFAEMRSGVWGLLLSGNWDLFTAAAQGALNTVLNGDILELRNAAVFMDASEKLGLYGYGTGWWDAIIFQYVPGQIVGYGLKNALQFHWSADELLQEKYGYSVPNGSTLTGVGDSFMQFSYLGCLSFVLIAYIFKTLYTSAVRDKSMTSRLLYMGLVSPAMVALSHGIGRFWQEAIFQCLFVGLTTYYSRIKTYQASSTAT